jgi:uncharacterized protein
MINKVLRVFIIVLLTVNGVHALQDGVSIPLVADRSTGDGDAGVLLGAQVIVTNGTGHVFVDTNPYTQVDLQGSARLAAMVASDVLGVDQRKYDFYYIIDISSPIIGGPSAGAALTVATIAAIKNWTLEPGIVMTGMINPDESLGPVGGIPYKLEAAAAKNTTLFLIPQGQSKVITTKTVSKSKGALIILEDQEETVDLIELGKKLNVTVKEVGTIQDAVLIYTGKEITRPTYKGTVLTTSYMDLLKPLAISLKNESGEMYRETSGPVTANQELKQAKDIIDQADKMYDDNKYYAATSLYFNSIFYLRYIIWNEGYDKAQDKEKYLGEIIGKVETQIQDSEIDLENFKMYGVVDVGAVGAAESRITAARAKFEEAKTQNNTKEKLSSLAFANERARTAQWWLTLATPDSKAVPENVLKDRAGWYLSQAQSIHTYTITLLSESGAHPGDLTSGVSDDLVNAQKEMDRGYYSGAIFDSLQASVKSSTIIGLMGLTDEAKKIEQSNNAAKAAINEARMAGIEPTLAISAYEYADTRTSTYDKISQYSYAKMVAKTSIVLNSYALPVNMTTIKPTLTPFIRETISPSVNATKEKPSTRINVPGFEYIAAITVILSLGLFIRRKIK